MNREKSMTASGIDVIAGLWLVLAPFVFGFAGTTLSTSNIIAGIVVTILAIVQLSTSAGMAWMGWVNGILGFWVLISPFVFAMATTASTWNNVIVGLVVAITSFWSASSSTTMSHPKMG